MWKATFTSLWKRKLRLAMSVVAIVLGVAFVAGSFIFSDMMRTSFKDITAGSVADVQVMRSMTASSTTGKAGESPIDQALVDKIADVDGVKSAAGIIEEMGVIAIGKNGKAVMTFGPPQLAFSWGDFRSLGNGTGLALREGRAPAADDEVALDPDTLRKSGYAIGDTIKVITPTAGTISAKVVGTATWGSGSTAGSTYVFFTPQRAQKLFLKGAPTFTGVWVTTDQGVDRKDVASKISKILPQGYEATDGETLSDEINDAVGEGLQFVNIFLLIFAGIALLVATFLILNTFTILVAQRSKELALYRAMGASRSQVRNTVVVEGLVLGLIGSLLGLVAGIGVAFGIKSLMSIGGYDMGSARVVISPTTALVSILTGLIVTLIAVVGPARKATKISPVEALSNAKTETEKGLGIRALIGVILAVVGVALILVSVLTHILPNPGAWALGGIGLTIIGVAIASPLLGRPVVWLVGKVYRAIFGEVGKLAELNSVRQPRRTAATASALMIGVTIVTMMSVFGASMSQSVRSQVTETVRGDFMVGQQNFQPFPREVRQKIEKVDSVEKVHATSFAAFIKLEPGQTQPPKEAMTDMSGKYFRSIAAMEPTELDKIFPQTLTSGRMYSAANEMIVEEDAAKEDKLKVGDNLSVFSPEAGRTITLKIVGLYSKGKAQPVVSLWTAPATFTQIGLGEQDNFLAIDLKPGADVAAAQKQLDDATKDMPLVSVMDLGDYTKTVLSRVDQMMTMVYGLLALSILIAILGIVNTLGLSIVERTREIGLLRAIALTRPQVRRMITLESIVIALLGAVVGVGMGTAFGIVLQRLMKDQGISTLAIPWPTLAILVVAAGIVGMLAALWPAHRAAGTNVLKAIASE